MAHNACLSNLESMSSRQHFPAPLAVRGTQDRMLVFYIQKEDAYVIETKLFADYLCKAE